MTTTCPHCSGEVTSEPSQAGLAVACPHCNEIFQIPGVGVPQVVCANCGTSFGCFKNPLDPGACCPNCRTPIVPPRSTAPAQGRAGRMLETVIDSLNPIQPDAPTCTESGENLDRMRAATAYPTWRFLVNIVGGLGVLALVVAGPLNIQFWFAVPGAAFAWGATVIFTDISDSLLRLVARK